MLWTDEDLLRLPVMIGKAQDAQISDIHISPNPTECALRIRQHGVMQTVRSLNHTNGRSLVQRIKAQANLNIAETRLSQDGRLAAQSPYHREVRVATHPCLHGENLVIRLYGQNHLRTIESLNVGTETAARLMECLSGQEGIILVAGPTGAGKTTTLHALMHTLNPANHNTMTLEDPVEIILPGAIQTDLSILPKMNFSLGLRSLLRQDPDIVLVGEIRDRETAELAIEAAMTGHRILASIHAADITSAIGRLSTLGIALPSLLPHLRGLICQRLISHHPTNDSKHAKQQRIPIMQIFNPKRYDRLERQSWETLRDIEKSLVKTQAWRFLDTAKEACNNGWLNTNDIPNWLWES
jgi:type II secretory ATPase GspE/PulE/Tfp pilus assembly ATPase PilB-like protein